MYLSKNNYSQIVTIALINCSLLLIGASPLGMEMTFGGGIAQLQNSSPTTTQTVETAVERANLTLGDFNPVVSNLISARQGIMSNNTIIAYDALNTAASELYRISHNLGGDNPRLVGQLSEQFAPVQNNINNAREYMRDGNSTRALMQIHGADIRLLGILALLPPVPASEEAVEEEED